MIEHEILLLGLLKDGPKHGYDIKRKNREVFSLFAGVDLKSVYYPLRILEKNGLVTKSITKSGRRPERLVYALTPKGQARFQELLTKSFLNFKRPQFSLDLSLYFLNFIKPSVAKRRLRARKQVLKKLSQDLRHTINSLSHKGQTPLWRISEHNLRMIETESEFLGSLLQDL